MRLSTKGRYALEALVLLGHLNHENEIISLKSVSSQANMSEGYLEQLFSMLKKHSIITSKKGKNGGYSLAKSAEKITVGDILRAVEGSLSPVKCLDKEHCNRKKECITRTIWKSAYDVINDTIDNITLRELMDDYMSRLNKRSMS